MTETRSVRGKTNPKTYLQKNVLEAARDRISTVFDHFEMVVVSYSGGKEVEIGRASCRERV